MKQLFTLKLIEVRKAEVVKEVSDKLTGNGGAELLSGADRLVLALLGDRSPPGATPATMAGAAPGAVTTPIVKPCADARSCEKACLTNDANACARLGYFYERGTGVTKDLARAVDLYQRSCSASGSAGALGCVSLGFCYEAGSGVPADLAKAAGLFRKGCEAESSLGCGKLGEFYELGRGVEVDAKKALSLYRKACDGGVRSACDALQRLAGNGG